MVSKEYFDKYLNSKINKLTILTAFISPERNNQGKRETMFRCICECGAMRDVRSSQVIAGLIKSCKGCSKVRKPRLTELEREVRKKETSNYMRKYRNAHKEELAARKKSDGIKAQEEGLALYGGKCTCCGESNKAFLTMEHINGRDKTKHRRTGKEAWLDAKRKNWPEDITILCFNCNCAKGIFGECPHKKNP